MKASTLHKGDRVLVRNVRLKGKHKLADKWEGVVYVIIDQHGDLPVYKVCPETQTGPSGHYIGICYSLVELFHQKYENVRRRVQFPSTELSVRQPADVLREQRKSLTLRKRKVIV